MNIHLCTYLYTSIVTVTYWIWTWVSCVTYKSYKHYSISSCRNICWKRLCWMMKWKKICTQIYLFFSFFNMKKFFSICSEQSAVSNSIFFCKQQYFFWFIIQTFYYKEILSDWWRAATIVVIYRYRLTFWQLANRLLAREVSFTEAHVGG